MWECPKCGRSFRNENQHHFCGKAQETIDEYILAQDESIRDQLQNVREVLRAELPNATEKISWSMPTYWRTCGKVKIREARDLLQEPGINTTLGWNQGNHWYQPRSARI